MNQHADPMRPRIPNSQVADFFNGMSPFETFARHLKMASSCQDSRYSLKSGGIRHNAMPVEEPSTASATETPDRLTQRQEQNSPMFP